MINANQIYEEDCLTFMEKLGSQNKFVDVTVTSPPYNINKEYRTYDDNKKKILLRLFRRSGERN
jgi:site-specific DNA-methyltransferase (adenine-specific)